MMPYAVFCERIARERDLLVAYEREMDKVRLCAARKRHAELPRRPRRRPTVGR